MVDSYLYSKSLHNSIYNTMLGANFPLSSDLNNGKMDDLSYVASKL